MPDSASASPFSLADGASVSAYIPAFQSEATLLACAEAVCAQHPAPRELIVIDDGSATPLQLPPLAVPARLIRHEKNLGRGAARARALQEAQGEFVLCCDATNALPPDFLSRALRWMAEPRVGAVCGRMAGRSSRTVADRWRTRHLYKTHVPLPVVRNATLAGGGTLVRRAAVLAAGNYDPRLRHTEDAELGARLQQHGWEVIFDPELKVESLLSNTLPEVLERYWRWHAGAEETTSAWAYLRKISFSYQVMARADLREGDPGAALVSLLVPHYEYWRSRWRRWRRVQG